jgi:hypothetical protein
VYLVPLGEQQLCQVRAVLPGDAGNECALGHVTSFAGTGGTRTAGNPG